MTIYPTRPHVHGFGMQTCWVDFTRTGVFQFIACWQPLGSLIDARSLPTVVIESIKKKYAGRRHRSARSPESARAKHSIDLDYAHDQHLLPQRRVRTNLNVSVDSTRSVGKLRTLHVWLIFPSYTPRRPPDSYR